MRAICSKKMAMGVLTLEKEHNAFSQGQKRAYDCKFQAMWLFSFLFVYL